MIKYVCFLFLVLSSFCANAIAELKIKPYLADYVIYTRGKQVGTSVNTLKTKEQRYVFSSTLSLKKFFKTDHVQQVSAGHLLGDGVQPDLFYVTHNGQSKFVVRAFKHGVFDVLSQLLMVRHHLLSQQAPGQYKAYSAKNKLHTYNYTIISENDVVKSKMGKVKTVHLRYTSAENQQIDEWLAKKYDYAPVLIRLSRAGSQLGAIYLTRYVNI